MRSNLAQRIPGVMVGLAVLVGTANPAFAAEPQENPETAQQVFSAISLLRYYTESLDFVLRKDPATVENRLGKMPFANIPESFATTADSFATSGERISLMIVEIDEDATRFADLLTQSRLREAMKLAAETFTGLALAYDELDSIEEAALTTGDLMDIASAQKGGPRRQAYEDLIEKIDDIRKVLDLYKSLLMVPLLESGAIGDKTTEAVDALEATTNAARESGVSEETVLRLADILARLDQGRISVTEAAKQAGALVEQLTRSGARQDLIQQLTASIERLKQADIPAGEAAAQLEEKLKLSGANVDLLNVFSNMKLLATAITLEIDPDAAFVGDNISVRGSLASNGGPLVGREIDILFDSGRYATFQTDASGRYQGTLQVPYKYVSEIGVQALYYPRENDAGVYLAAISPEARLAVMFYETELEIGVEEKAYPGLETVITGRLDYSRSPPLDERKVEIFLGDILVFEGIERPVFARRMAIDAGTDRGTYTVTAAVTASGQYAPAVADAVIDITKAMPVLDMSPPRVAMVPGSISFAGTLNSDLGPVNNASVTIGMGKYRSELTSSRDGAFDGRIRAGFIPGFVGRQNLTIDVLPGDPWFDALTTTRSLTMVNWVNLGGLLAALAFFTVYAPRRLRRRLGLPIKERQSAAVKATRPEGIPTYSRAAVPAITPAAAQSDDAPKEPRERIFYWYRIVARLLAAIMKTLLGPQQTLREFAEESSQKVGAAGQRFTELTHMVERLLYSRYDPTEADAEKSKQISTDVSRGVEG